MSSRWVTVVAEPPWLQSAHIRSPSSTCAERWAIERGDLKYSIPERDNVYCRGKRPIAYIASTACCNFRGLFLYTAEGKRAT